MCTFFRSNEESNLRHPEKLVNIHSALHYDLELNINKKEENIIEGVVKIYLEIHQKTNKLYFHADRQITDIINGGINVFKCSTGKFQLKNASKSKFLLFYCIYFLHPIQVDFFLQLLASAAVFFTCFL